MLWFKKKTKQKNKEEEKNPVHPIKSIEPEISPSVEFKPNGKFLLCDDTGTNRTILGRYLQLKGYTSDEAVNGADAIEKIKQNGQYIIVWMDVQMPYMDGVMATKVLRNELNYKGTIIGLTGYVDQESFNRFLAAGMNHVIPKPIDKKVLYSYAEKYSSILNN